MHPVKNVKLLQPLSPGYYHQVKLAAKGCSAQSAIIVHRLLHVPMHELGTTFVTGTARATPWAEDCEPVVLDAVQIDHADEDPTFELSSTVRGAIATRRVL